MIQERLPAENEMQARSSRAHWLLELAGISAFALLAALIGWQVYGGAASFGYAWSLPAIAILAYLAADLASGMAHFLADNFGSEETPIIGPIFIGPFRDHHVDPKGIVRNDFVDTNGNNCLAIVPFMLLFWLAVPDPGDADGLPFRGLLSVGVPRGFPDQPVPQVGAHRGATGAGGVAPAAGCHPLRRAPRRPPRQPVRHLLLHNRRVLEPAAGSDALLRAGGALDPALRTGHRAHVALRKGREPQRVGSGTEDPVRGFRGPEPRALRPRRPHPVDRLAPAPTLARRAACRVRAGRRTPRRLPGPRAPAGPRRRPARLGPGL